MAIDVATRDIAGIWAHTGLQDAIGKWCAANDATVTHTANPTYGLAVVTAVLADSSTRQLEFVLAVG